MKVSVQADAICRQKCEISHSLFDQSDHTLEGGEGAQWVCDTAEPGKPGISY